MRSPETATSARRAGAPVPSMSSPFLMTRSYLGPQAAAHASETHARSRKSLAMAREFTRGRLWDPAVPDPDSFRGWPDLIGAV